MLCGSAVARLVSLPMSCDGAHERPSRVTGTRDSVCCGSCTPTECAKHSRDRSRERTMMREKCLTEVASCSFRECTPPAHVTSDHEKEKNSGLLTFFPLRLQVFHYPNRHHRNDTRSRKRSSAVPGELDEQSKNGNGGGGRLSRHVCRCRPR